MWLNWLCLTSISQTTLWRNQVEFMLISKEESFSMQLRSIYYSFYHKIYSNLYSRFSNEFGRFIPRTHPLVSDGIAFFKYLTGLVLFMFHLSYILPVPSYLFFSLKFVVTFSKIHSTHILLGIRGDIEFMDSFGTLTLSEAVSETIPLSEGTSSWCLLLKGETSLLGIYFYSSMYSRMKCCLWKSGYESYQVSIP